MIHSLKNKNVLITGISGFLGSSLAQQCALEGANVVGILRDQTKVFENKSYNIAIGKIEDLGFLRRVVDEYEIEVCFHLAAQAIVSIWDNNPAEVFETNIKGTWSILEACRMSKKVKSIIIASSDKAYGNQENLPYKEQNPLNGTHPYEASKISAEIIARAYFATYDMPIGITRCGNLYGPGDYNLSRVVPGTICSILRGEAPIIRGDGMSLRDYLYIEDGAEAYIRFAKAILDGRLAGEAINFGTGQPYCVREIVEKIIKLLNTDIRYIILGQELSKEIKHQYLDISKAGELLSWAPKYSLDEGLKRSVDWYASRFTCR